MKRFFSLVLVGLCVPVVPVEPVSGNPATVPIVVARCAADPVCRVAVVTIGGALYWQVRQAFNSDPILVPVPRGIDAYSPLRQPRRLPRQRRSTQRVPGASRIDNPDEPVGETFTIDYVWGINEREARQRCRAIVRANGLTFVNVRRTSKRGNKWECNVRRNDPNQYVPDYRRR